MYNKRVVLTKLMYKIIEDGAKFKIKEIDENGGTLGILEEVFDTHEAATEKIKDLEGNTEEKEETPAATPEDGTSQTVSPETPATDVPAAPEGENEVKTEDAAVTPEGDAAVA